MAQTPSGIRAVFAAIPAERQHIQHVALPVMPKVLARVPDFVLPKLVAPTS